MSNLYCFDALWKLIVLTFLAIVGAFKVGDFLGNIINKLVKGKNKK